MYFVICTVSGMAEPDRMLRSGHACVRQTMPICMWHTCCARAGYPAELEEGREVVQEYMLAIMFVRSLYSTLIRKRQSS